LTHIQGTSNILIGVRTGFAKEEMQYNILYNSSYLDLQRKKCNIIYYTIHHISLEEVNVANPYLQRNYYLKGH
jgi:hypothetical protein